MPLQNRVTSFGDFVATRARGTLMGNRGGALHDEQRRLGKRRWRGRRWIACTLCFKDRRRVIMAPGLYTELFFLDEATALAAGHRPCCECRLSDYRRFAAAWNRARDLPAGRKVPVGEIDAALHADRLEGKRQKRVPARLSELPDGAMVVLPDAPGEAWLIWHRRLHHWSHEGYHAPREAAPSTMVAVLTPSTTVAIIAAGYRPSVHASLGVAAGPVTLPALA